jgi:hypothetical protein
MGRPKGARGLATIERERVAAEIAQRTIMDAKPTGKRLAKEVLYECMMTFADMASFYQPTQADLTAGRLIENPHTDEPMFLKYANLTVDTAAKLAPYESPTFKSVPVPDPTSGVPKIKAIDLDYAIDLNDPNAVARVYRQMMTADD